MKRTIALYVNSGSLKKQLIEITRQFTTLPERGAEWCFEWADNLEDIVQSADCIILDNAPEGWLPTLGSLGSSPPVILLGKKDSDNNGDYFKDFLPLEYLTPIALEQSLRHNIEKSRLEHEVNYLRNHDSVTGLANQDLFFKQLVNATEQARQNNQKMAILMIRIDGFDNLLRRLNYTSENILLQAFVHRLSTILPGRSLIARAKQDNEALILLPKIDSVEEIKRLAQAILHNMRRGFEANDQKVNLTVSIGASSYPDHGTDAASIIQATRDALEFSAARAGDRFCLFDNAIAQASKQRLEIIQALPEALTRHELEVRYQPQMVLETSRISGAEALLRWHRAAGDVPPETFIPLIESSSDILHIGEWVLREATRVAEGWVTNHQSKIRLAVNVSGHQFRDKKILLDVEDLLQESNLPPDQLELELTERVFVENIKTHRDVFTGLKDMGVRIAMDDFGVGYSSLSYLKHFSVDTLKIDRSFIASLPDSDNDAAIVRAIIAMGHRLDMRVIAEGIETESQLEFLHQHHCDEVQGHFFMADLSAEKFDQLISRMHDEEK